MSQAARAELTCSELVELVTDYVEGILPGAERARFELHLDRCPGCREYLRQIRETIRIAGRLSERSLPGQARVALLHAFRDWKARRGPL